MSKGKSKTPPPYISSWVRDEGPKVLKALVEGRLMVVTHHRGDAQGCLVVTIGYGELFVLSGQLLLSTLCEYAMRHQDLQEAYSAIDVLRRFFTQEAEQRIRSDIMDRINDRINNLTIT